MGVVTPTTQLVVILLMIYNYRLSRKFNFIPINTLAKTNKNHLNQKIKWHFVNAATPRSPDHEDCRRINSFPIDLILAIFGRMIQRSFHFLTTRKMFILFDVDGGSATKNVEHIKHSIEFIQVFFCTSCPSSSWCNKLCFRMWANDLMVSQLSQTAPPANISFRQNHFISCCLAHNSSRVNVTS